ncbi:MAG: TetR/AcrR family transcriptional regulator [Polyangiales bacterium]
MARAKEFDRELVLERAMEYFWERGYEAASMRELLDAMEIGRQSLYDTFGDKHSLFLASLEHYYQLGLGSIIAELGSPDGGLSAIEAYFDRLSRQMSKRPHRSCLLINSAVEVAPHDPEVAVIVNRFVKRLRKAFAAALKVAVEKGEARVEDVDATAWNLTNSAMGFGPMSKARISYKDLKRVNEQILNNLRA